MKRWRWIRNTAAAFLLMPLAALLTFDLLWFTPRLEQVRSLVAAASPEDRSPTPLIERMVRASEPSGLRSQVARIILTQSEPHFRPAMLWWHSAGWLSMQLLRVHSSDRELMAIYCSRIGVGEGAYGLSAAAILLFQKPLSALSRDEAASVAAYPFAPAAFRLDRSRLVPRRDFIRERDASAL